jgi:hypothetical protein
MNKILAVVAVSLAACGGQVDGVDPGDGDGSENGGSGSGYGSSVGSGYGYGSGSSDTGSGYYGGGHTTSGYGSGTSSTGYGSGTGSDDCGGPPPGVCGLPEGCNGGLVCESGVWTCEVWDCEYQSDAGTCEGDAPYCVNACGDTEPSYCDGDGNWACPPSPPCFTDAGVGSADGGVVIGVPLPP